MATPMGFELLKQLFKKPATNLFPVTYCPDSILKLLGKVEKGEAKINPPVEIPKNFRGKIVYDRDACIGCKLCIKVCPAEAIEFIPDNKKVKIHIDRCIFCAQCNDICPKNCLNMSEEFLLADADRLSSKLIVE
ncbi:MAG: 4Fe-4S dicluster domain-containing protein [Candidatus Atribacteria bacterium]|nr:4Fe-4S dicluster domain-containing protein [Candidatus Atribacteria bacterium]